MYLWRRKLYVLVMIIVSDGKTSRHLFFCVLTRSVFYILILRTEGFCKGGQDFPLKETKAAL